MKTLLLSFLGALLALVFIVLVIAAGVAVKTGGGPEVDKGDWLEIDLYGSLPEYNPPADPMSKLMGKGGQTLTSILDNLEKARVDERITGVMLKIGPNGAGWGSLEEIRGALHALRAEGKPAFAWSDNLDLKGLFLAAACDSVFMIPAGDMSITGVQSQSTHVRRALDKLGIKPNLHKIKDYKSAAEVVMRENLSEPAKENTRWLIDEFWSLATAVLEKDRGLSEEALLAAMKRALFSTEEAVEMGLIDGTLYYDELTALLAGRFGGDDDDENALPTVSAGEYAKVERKKLDLDGDKIIAVIHAQGSIGGRKNRVDPLLGVMMGHESVSAQLKAAREDEDVAAIVFRVDSGGGESLASDLIGHEVANCAAEKPIICSMVDVAASGGYHIAYVASKVMADAFTVTGSIGSISGKFNISEFHEKLGLTHDSVEFGPNADFWSSQRDFSPEQWEAFKADHWRGFNHWLADVADKRGMSFEEAEKLAHGRVWTGSQALANGLIDAVGGLDTAIAMAKEMAEIPADEQVTVQHFPEEQGLLAMITGGGDMSAAANWLVYRWLREDLAETWRLVEQGILEERVSVPR
jgi:protease IV